ncbi:hypothetical protein [Roseovarius sp.]|uniref:hypothetical protein n=1 Tax=Roseovarius sp. TaxID=1486281 RepID=UPI0035678A00
MTIDECVADYIRRFRERARAEIADFAKQKQESLSEVITLAAACQCKDGKRHSHQRRIPSAVLSEAARELHAHQEALSTAQNFNQLHSRIDAVIGPIHGVGELTVYDIAHRIGGFIGLEPEEVYLHAGARVGAAALGVYGKVIEKDQLPDAFAPLTAAEIEDCLCIYKGLFSEESASPSDCDKRAPVSGCFPKVSKRVRSC